MKALGLLLLIALGLSGCSLFSKTPEPPPVIKTEYVTVKVREDLLVPCVPTNKPVTKEIYLRMAPVEREQYLADYIVGLLGDMNVCSSRFSGISKILSSPRVPIEGK